MPRSVKILLFGTFALLLVNFVECSRIRPTTTTPTRSPNLSNDIKITICREGFRISLYNTENLERFSVHLNVNSHLKPSLNGHYNKDLRTPVNNSWVYEECGTTLRERDRLSFWVSVQRNQLLFIYEDQRYIVKGDDITSECSCPTAPQHSVLPVFRSEPCSSDKLDTLLEEVSTLQGKVSRTEEEIKELNEIIEYVLQRDLVSTKVLITGNNPVDSDLLALVKEFVSDKLELFSIAGNIKSATRIDSGIIVEMKTSRDAMKLVARGKIKLANSRFTVNSYIPNYIDPVLETRHNFS